MTKVDENDRLRAGTLPRNPEDGCEPMPPNHPTHPAPTPVLPSQHAPRTPARKLGDILDETFARIARRASGAERPIELPWQNVNRLLGGGLWPGVHVLISGTGTGKTQWALQAAMAAALKGTPVAYVGLELPDFQVATRLLVTLAHATTQTGTKPPHWSELITGQCNRPDAIASINDAAASLRTLPIYLERGSPTGWPASNLISLATQLRSEHPTTPGAPLPLLFVIDFLQLVGPEPDALRLDLRERIGRAAYLSQEIAQRFDAAVLLVSSSARGNYGPLAGDFKDSDPGFAISSSGRCYLQCPDALVGLGKESGEIEYSADSVLVAVKAGQDTDDAESRKLIAFTAAKIRAGIPGWAPLTFDGTLFTEGTPRDTLTALENRTSKTRSLDTSATPGHKAKSTPTASYVPKSPTYEF